ncbi:MAG: hypothetical protein IJ079_06950 [Lachnospiraceae bacterium]|nr:hypothetical protein [Lachnospiraceae bacterium]
MEYSRHLLDNLYPDNHLLLLEAIIPYMDPSMQLPLALYIKFQEVQFILSAFRNPDWLSSCGFYPGHAGNEDLLRTLSQAMGFDLNMYNNSFSANPTGQSYAQPSDQYMPPEKQIASDYPDDTEHQESKDDHPAMNDDFSNSRNNMIDAIKDILRERNE